jgi:AcrR family transcriptional regulator
MPSIGGGNDTPPRLGRPRDPGIDTAVLDATIDVLEAAGYSGLTLEAVAKRAGTTKPAIYRRWRTRQHLVLAALARRLGELPVPDTGCTLCDLGDGIGVFADAFERMPADVVGPLFSDCASDPDLRDAFMAALFQPPRAAVEEMLTRAIERGDLRSDLSLQLVLDLLGSLVYFRALFEHEPTGSTDVEAAVHTLCHGIATDYPALVEHNRRLTGDPSRHSLHAH